MWIRTFGRGLALVAVLALAAPMLTATAAQAQVNKFLPRSDHCGKFAAA